MTAILVSGLINIETTLRINGFPLDYSPVHYPFHGVRSSVSGVGYNLAKALTTLGDEVRFVSLIGKDLAGREVYQALKENGIRNDYIRADLEETAQSVILYTPGGQRQIHVDLKDIQEREYPWETFFPAIQDCPLVVLCNINFSRQYLAFARHQGKLIATDVHTISSLDDPYNADFMRAADILFLSDEHLPDEPQIWARKVLERYGNEIVVIGMGPKGALLTVKADNFIGRIPAVFTRPVVNSIGAGDALFACFLHYYIKNKDPYESLRKAMIFASYKIGADNGAADGFLDEAALEGWIRTGAKEG